MLSRTLLRASAPRSARIAFPAIPRASVRFYADQPSSSHPAHPTEPHTPPKPKNFFRKEKIGLEVTPLFALIGTIVLIATGAIVRNLVKDPDIHSRHGVEVDDKLKKVLEMDEAGEKEKSQVKK